MTNNSTSHISAHEIFETQYLSMVQLIFVWVQVPLPALIDRSQ